MTFGAGNFGTPWLRMHLAKFNPRSKSASEPAVGIDRPYRQERGPCRSMSGAANQPTSFVAARIAVGVATRVITKRLRRSR